MKPLVVNFFGGPGSGKSTMASAVFAALKFQNYNVELVREYAKELAWMGWLAGTNQYSIFNEQLERQEMLYGKVEAIITDSPLLVSIFYARYKGLDTPILERRVQEEWEKAANLNFFVRRVKPFNPAGREQTEKQARQIDDAMKGFLLNIGEELTDVQGTYEAVDHTVAMIINTIQRRDEMRSLEAPEAFGLEKARIYGEPEYLPSGVPKSQSWETEVEGERCSVP